jgi:putative component of membrane protein insertase Oxa1/YidC/SpoIIIJ protein YidD
MKQVLLAAIWLYRRFLSPYKGFACATRVATGGESCSAYGRRVVARFGAGKGIGLLRRRLAGCGEVHRRTAYADTLLRRQRGECGLHDCDWTPCDMITCDCGNPATWRKSKQPAHLRVKARKGRK